MPDLSLKPVAGEIIEKEDQYNAKYLFHESA
jgi:hypothetical protein